MQFPRAATAYGRAKALASGGPERDYADLLQTRAMKRDPCACAPSTHQNYQRLLSSDAKDDQGIPIALYAARELLYQPVEHRRVLDLIERQLGKHAWFHPTAMST